jgi:hypothetical protein
MKYIFSPSLETFSCALLTLCMSNDTRTGGPYADMPPLIDDEENPVNKPFHLKGVSLLTGEKGGKEKVKGYEDTIDTSNHTTLSNQERIAPHQEPYEVSRSLARYPTFISSTSLSKGNGTEEHHCIPAVSGVTSIFNYPLPQRRLLLWENFLNSSKKDWKTLLLTKKVRLICEKPLSMFPRAH